MVLPSADNPPFDQLQQQMRGNETSSFLRAQVEQIRAVEKNLQE